MQGSLEACLEVVDVEVVVAVEADEVVLVALVVAHEDVLAMHGAVVAPPSLCLFYGLALGMLIAGKRDVVFLKVPKHLFLSV